MMANECIRIGRFIWKKWETFKYLGSLLENQSSVQEDIKCSVEVGNSCYFTPNTFCFLTSLAKFENLNI